MKALLACMLLALPLWAQAGTAEETPAARSAAQKYIDNVLSKDPNFKNAVVGIMAIDQNGDELAQWNPSYPLLTASTLKTVTTGLGLSFLGPDYRYETRVGYTGEIRDSVLNGNLYIIGGGDPTLGSKDTVAFPIDSIFGIWSDAIARQGIARINGNIIVDDSWMEREQIPDSWTWGNIGASYGSCASGLSFCENTQEFELVPGGSAGEKATVTAVYPQVPGLEILNGVTTGEAGSGDRSWYYIQDMAPICRFTGTIPVDRRKIVSTCSNRFPQLSCGWHFREFLLGKGIASKEGIIDLNAEEPFTDSLGTPQVIAVTYSPELRFIVNVTNRISNNFFAETIFKTIGKEMTGCGSYDSSRVAVRRLLDEYGVGTDGFNTVDGSGLSRQDFVTPQFFCRYYTMMAENDIFNIFLESFPYPGGGGTLKNVLKDTPAEIKGRIHAKSGSLDGVRCYAGYVETAGKRGLVKFAILVNNYHVRTSVMQPKIEKFLLELAQCR